MTKNKIEIFIHLVFWVFVGASLNVDWTADWFDSSNRPNSPAPLSVILFAGFFYLHTFVLLPNYFSVKTWKPYAAYAFALFVLPELVRILIYKLAMPGLSLEAAVFSRDSFLFGTPSPFFLAVSASFIYRFARDRLLSHRSAGVMEPPAKVPYMDATVLPEEEARELQKRLKHQLEHEEIFLNPDLSLRELAGKIDSTEKKVSYLLNQHLETSFYELINRYRVEKFKVEIGRPDNEQLSIVGVAFNCGFPSKSSFYRAFRAEVAMSPSEYLKQIAGNRNASGSK